MKSPIQFIEERASSTRLIALIVLVVVALLSVHVFNTPWSLVRMRGITGGPLILDMEFHYNAQHANDLLTAIGPNGRSYYLWRILAVLDFVLPAIFASVLSVGMSMAFRGVVAKDSALRVLQWLPLAALGLDYLENALITHLLLSFPVEHQLVAAMAGWVTTAKTVAYMGSLAICLGALVKRGLNATRRSVQSSVQCNVQRNAQ